MELVDRPAAGLCEDLRARRLTAAELLEAVLARIDAREAEVGAYLTLRDGAELRAEARAADERLARGEPLGALDGIPVSVKDNICTEGLRTTCASRMLEHFVPPYDATVAAKLRVAGAILLGKTNLDEFAMGASTENSALGVTRNPHDPTRVPGGTSGGAAASVAAGETILAVGSDTGGSIRQPASFCGVVGVKPTYGRVSRYGLVAYASSFDQIGALARDVPGAALLLAALSGHDPMDSTSVPGPPVAEPGAPDGAALRVGVPREYFGEALDPEVGSAVEGAADVLSRAGHEVKGISLPSTAAAIASYYIIACAEASSNLARFDGVKYGYRAPGARSLREMYERTRSEGFGPEVRKRILLGTYVLSAGYYDAYYEKACRVRTLVRRELEEAFSACDVILHPVAPTPAYPLGSTRLDPLRQYTGDVYSVVANLVGMPALSLPCGRSGEGLPIGVQLCARPFADERLLAAALALERLLAEGGAWPG